MNKGTPGLASRLPATEWLALFKSRSPRAVAALEAIYGSPTRQASELEQKLRSEILEGRLEKYIAALESFNKEFPALQQEEVAIIRCPARVNMRGMHTDSHGGGCNALVVALETLIVVHPSSIDNKKPQLFTIKNANQSFAELSFDMSDPPALPTGWGKYIIGTLEVLMDHYLKEQKAKGVEDPKGVSFNGLTALISSDIPTGSGLSSSHSLVMGFVSAILQANPSLPEIDPIALLELARAVEGKAGAVTGLGDQGAMRFAKEGHVLHTCFYQNDHSVIQPQYAPWPHSHALVIVESLKKRDLGGKEAANYAVPRFAYSIGLGLLKEIMARVGYPIEFVETVDRLSRLSGDHFAEHGGAVSVYKLLKAIPEWVTVSDLIASYPALEKVVKLAEETYLSKLPLEKQPKRLALRGPLLFGISECERARMFFKLLNAAHAKGEEGKSEERLAILREVGELMDIGHKGDSDLYATQHPISDEYLDGLIERLEKDGNDRDAQLARQPGAFSGSITELDEIQSILMHHSAVGASLTGAGMGGAVVCFAALENIDKLKEAVAREYYAVPHAHFPSSPLDATKHIHVTFPIAGVGFVVLKQE